MHVDLNASAQFFEPAKEVLATLHGNPNIHSLDLERMGVTDETLEQLAGLKDLRSLNLSSNHFTDAGLKNTLRAWPN